VNGADPVDSPMRLIAFSLTPWGHHSNGQDGCLYTDQTRLGEECVDGTRLPGTPRATKQVDGSFSTNYARLEPA